WVEMRYKMPAQKMEYVMKFLVDSSTDHKVQKAYAGAVDGKGKEIGISDAGSDPQTSDDYEYAEEELSGEDVKVPAGEFSCTVKQIKMSKKDGAYQAESLSYTCADVPLSGMVKTTTDTTMQGGMKAKSEVLLVGKGNDAKSELKTE
ncbi:MAG: hypothetical protein AABZ60_24235, partial [Planctomycetota bacterium]